KAAMRIGVCFIGKKKKRDRQNVAPCGDSLSDRNGKENVPKRKAELTTNNLDECLRFYWCPFVFIRG
ncbi:MAG: hypothetical protein KDM63_10290, partial [Verrucomicrobiae bacterium]|nr:hypothetical protein [Verrucomicrobiae bacterium]